MDKISNTMTRTYTTTVTVNGKPYTAKARRCANEQDAERKIFKQFVTNFPNCDIFVGKLVPEDDGVQFLKNIFKMK